MATVLEKPEKVLQGALTIHLPQNRVGMMTLSEEYQKFAPLCPEFVIELMSPSDSLKDAKEKMLEYIANGAELGWLIEPGEKCVYVYTASGVETLENPESVAGVGRLEGFVLDLKNIW